MDWGQFAIQFGHVLLSIFWFGSVLFADFVLLPAISPLPLARQQEIASVVGARSARIMPLAAVAVIVLGFLRGTVFGDIHAVDDLTTTYGIAFVVSLLAGIATLLWGLRVITPAIDRMVAFDPAAAGSPEGGQSPALARIMAQLRRYTLLELGGFLVMFVAMIVMGSVA